MKNRNEQPSAKQKTNQDMQNRNDQNMRSKADNRMESCSKNKDMKNSVSNVKNEMRTENTRVENNNMRNTRKEQ